MVQDLHGGVTTWILFFIPLDLVSCYLWSGTPSLGGPFALFGDYFIMISHFQLFTL
jgi:hypothetical protein